MVGGVAHAVPQWWSTAKYRHFRLALWRLSQDYVSGEDIFNVGIHFGAFVSVRMPSLQL